MADPTYKKISELTELAEHPARTDYFAFVDASATATKRVTLANIDPLQFLELADPGGDFMAFWDDSASVMDWLTPGDGLTITGGALDVDILGVEDLVDPGADRIMFWDDSAGAMKWLTAGDGLTLSGTTLSAGIAEGQIADGAVTTAKLADDAVTDAKIGERVIKLPKRMGGSSTDWDEYGGYSKVPGDVKMLAGVTHVVTDELCSFPESFTYKPIVFAMPVSSAAGFVTIGSVAVNQFTAYAWDEDGIASEFDVMWIAIGEG